MIRRNEPRRARFAASLLGAAAIAFQFAGCDAIHELLHPTPPIQFAPAGESYADKPDFAQVEQQFPLSADALQKLTPANIANFSQEELDQIYARLTAGPIPDGPFDGELIFPKAASENRRLAGLGGARGVAFELTPQQVEGLPRALWKGKVFYRDQRLLRNRVDDFVLFEPIVDHPESIPRVALSGKSEWLLFPARLYCGQSLLDGRRESIIIDHFFADQLPGYRERPDSLAGRNGLQVRDEIRMVWPGFYLGRAYVGGVFLIDFWLYSGEIAERDGPAFQRTGRAKEDCWPGTQQRVAVATR